MLARLIAPVFILAFAVCSLAHGAPQSAEIERALTDVPPKQRASMEWLVAHMPPEDRATLSSAFLLAHVAAATEAWEQSPWRGQVDEAMFREAILPYANISEKRELWMLPLHERSQRIITDMKTAPTLAACAAELNQKLFAETGVKYSTKRARADQSPSESIASGLASCSGLSILLIDACRSVGIPARFVGVPMWVDGSGNHSWVEIWDGARWRFTGAAEATGDRLDEGWFAGRAAGQNNAKPEHAIYAVTWRDTGVEFPMRFTESAPRVFAVDVTSRYTSGAVTIPEGQQLVRVAVRDRATKARVSQTVVCTGQGAQEFARGVSKDERADLNDHLELIVPKSSPLTFAVEGVSDSAITQVDGEGGSGVSTISLFVDADAPIALTKVAAERVTKSITKPFLDAARKSNAAAFKSRVLKHGAVEMPFWFTTYGEKPKSGRSLFISMHGGGGAPKEVNDQQWENQKKLYRPEEGVYCAPRAPTNSWNLWHEGHIDPLFDQLIRDMILFEDVDPNKVYIMGYSAGGDGVFQLAPRMADRFAAAAMMAGHPNETKPDGLRNLPFALHMGGNDAAFKRNEIGRQWKVMLDELSAKDLGGYPHEAVIHEGKGHWMDREDAVAVPWMAKFTRDLRPTRIVWLQDDVTENRFYWLAVKEPKAGQRVVVVREGQCVTIEEAAGVTELCIRLDDSMLDLDKAVKVVMAGRVLFEGIVPRMKDVIVKTLEERGDPTGIFTAEIKVQIPAAL